jgi:hypothetical protein
MEPAIIEQHEVKRKVEFAETSETITKMVQNLLEDLTNEIERRPDFTLQPPTKQGRPLIVPDYQTLLTRLKDFFVPFPCPPTKNALCCSLGLADEKSLKDMAERGNEFSAPLKRALCIIKAYWEANLDRGQCAGAIFWLKNVGWTDRGEAAGDENLTPEVVEYRNIPKPVASTELAQGQEPKALPEGCPQVDDTESGI